MWQTTPPPYHRHILAYGYPICDISGLRDDITHKIVEANEWDDQGFTTVNDDNSFTKFEVIGWIDIPVYPHTLPIQPLPEGQPKYKVGDVTQYKTRYEGIQNVTITSVLIWPNGFFYGLDKLWDTGHGNPKVGSDSVEYSHDGMIYCRPISELELNYGLEDL
jgi:hypothetical protein